MPNWNFQLLGEFRCIAPDTSEVTFPGRKHQALIAIVLLSNGQLITRERMLGLLWGSRSDEQARASLRGVLSEIRRTCRLFGHCPINIDRTHIALSSHTLADIDLLRKATRGDDLQACAAVAQLNASELLASLKINERAFEQWKETEQAVLQTNYRNTLINYLEILWENRQTDEIEYVANRLLKLDDTDENAHRALMQLYHNCGNRSLALRQFELCENRMHTLYDSPASKATQTLAQQIKIAPVHPLTTSTPIDQTLAESPMSEPSGVSGIALAVIPFALLPGSNIDTGFINLLAEEIAGAASRFNWFRVIPTSETFRLDIKILGASGISAETGAKYVLGGRCRRLKQGYLLTAELIDGVNADTVWSESITLSERAIFNPEEVLERIIGQLDVKLRASETRQAYRLSHQVLTGYECTLLALSNMSNLSETTYQEAEELFDRAIRLSPNSSWFYSFWSLWKMFCLGHSWVEDHSAELNTSGNLARQAIKRDPDDALALAILGYFESFWKHDIPQGRKHLDQSLSLNPYSSFAWMLSATAYSHSGQPLEALRRLKKSRGLCPIEPHFEFLYDTASCIAHLFNRDLKQALLWGYKIVRSNPDFTHGYKHLLVALGHLNHRAECERYLNRLLQLEPGFIAEVFIHHYPFGNDADRQFYCDGLRRAGVPQGNVDGSQ